MGVRVRSALAIAVATIGGCTPDFAGPAQVVDLRILAIQADPPEVLVPLGEIDTAQPPPIEIRALAVDPRAPAKSVDWELWVCSTDGFSCADATLARRRRATHTPLDQINHTLKIDRELIETARDVDPFQGFGGIPLFVELRIFPNDGPAVLAIKRLVFGATLPIGKQPNKNPQLLEVQAQGAVTGETIAVSCSDELELLPVPDHGAAESYVVATFSDPLVEGLALEEHLSYAFFTSYGGFSHSETGGVPNPFFKDQKIESPWSSWIPQDLSCSDEGRLLQPPSVTDRIWIVVRDDRGGVSWRAFAIAEKPPS